jgi:hypothetical protein
MWGNDPLHVVGQSNKPSETLSYEHVVQPLYRIRSRKVRAELRVVDARHEKGGEADHKECGSVKGKRMSTTERPAEHTLG